jgi:hypothetical protein
VRFPFDLFCETEPDQSHARVDRVVIPKISPYAKEITVTQITSAMAAEEVASALPTATIDWLSDLFPPGTFHRYRPLKAFGPDIQAFRLVTGLNYATDFDSMRRKLGLPNQAL